MNLSLKYCKKISIFQIGIVIEPVKIEGLIHDTNPYFMYR